jgi:hypothetical protein
VNREILPVVERKSDIKKLRKRQKESNAASKQKSCFLKTRTSPAQA